MFDAVTLSAIIDELRPILEHGRLQRVLLLDELSLGLEIYADHRRHQLLISAHPQNARMHLVEARLTADRERVTPFLLLLRKYLRGGQVLAITQPPLERIVALSIAKRLPLDKPRAAVVAEPPAAPTSPGQVDLTIPSPPATADTTPVTPPPPDTAPTDDEEELDDETPAYEVVTTLMVELMGRHSNIILLDSAGQIMDSIKRVPASVNRYRTVLPRRPYRPPPDQPKADPHQVDLAWVAQLLAANIPTTPLAPLLVRELKGISPQVAREIAWRATGTIEATLSQLTAPEALPAAIAEIMAVVTEHRWQPYLYRQTGQPVAFSPFPLLSLANHEAVASESISAVVANYFNTERSVTGHSQSKTRLLGLLRAERDKVAARQRSIAEQLQAGAAAEQHRQAGELIYAYLHTLQPGQRLLEVDGQRIELDPELTPVENAQARFERYRRAKAAVANLPELAAAAATSLAYYDQLLTFAEQAEGFDELQAIEAEWRGYEQAGRSPATALRRRPPASRGPRRLHTVRGDTLLIGRNGQQNDLVTFDLAGPDDLWLHARGLPGAHVILQWRGAPSDRFLEAAAQLAAYYSPARAATAVEVDITERRHVRKIKGGPPGLVTYRQERTVRVAPRAEEALRDAGLLAPG